MRSLAKVFLAVPLLAAAVCTASGQAGRRARPANESGLVLNVTATKNEDPGVLIAARQVSLYDNGIEQAVKSFVHDPSPARIVLLVDNSLTLRADIEKLEAAAREFAYEIFEGDKLLIVGYDEQAEIVADWTDDAKSIEASLAGFRKKGDPQLFDALLAVSEEALRPLSGSISKRVIVVISDGLDRGSGARFEKTLANLQSQDITVYWIQAPDRTGGAIRRDQPKPVQVVNKLVEGTGGMIFSINEPRLAAEKICGELRKNRYLLSYSPSNVPFGQTRRLLVAADEGITVRFKLQQPPN